MTAPDMRALLLEHGLASTSDELVGWSTCYETCYDTCSNWWCDY